MEGTMGTATKAETPGKVPGSREGFRRYRDLDHGIATCPWLRHRARQALLALMGYVDMDGVCWPSLGSLAASMACDVRTVKRALAELRGPAIVTRVERGVFQVDLVKVAALSGDHDRGDRAVPSGDRAVPSKGTRLSPRRGQNCPLPLLRELKDQEPHTTERARPIGEAPSEDAEGAVCVLGEESQERQVRWVAEAFPLPRDRGGRQVVPKALGEACWTACVDYGAPVVRRAVELLGAASWRTADLGAWVFTSSAFVALVAKAQDEQRTRARRAARRVTQQPAEDLEELIGAAGLGWRRVVGE
jgi:helix-turn-helix protein